MQKYLAEGFGTFVLTMVVGLSMLGSFSLATPILAVLTVGLFVYAIGPISGAHINPAVTIGLLSIKKIKLNEALKYCLSQLLGSFVAFAILLLHFHLPFSPTSISPALSVIVAEFFGMFVYAFLIAAYVDGKVPSSLSGIFIAGSLLLGISVAVLIGSLGFINPAVASGLHYVSFPYFWAPILGSVAGMKVFQYLIK